MHTLIKGKSWCLHIFQDVLFVQYHLLAKLIDSPRLF